MNWSCNYRLDSDIPIPYGALFRQKMNLQIDYLSIYNRKETNAVWFVSHCQESSERRFYANEMIRYGFDIDILGGCGPDGQQTKSNNAAI
jgi:hypothetical protein